MARSPLTRRLFTLHSWLGLATGLLLLVVSLSGVALLFEPELDHALNLRLLTVAVPAAPRPSLDRVLTAARPLFPQPASLRLRRLLRTPTDAVEVSVDQPDHAWTLAYFDPLYRPLSGAAQRPGAFPGLAPGAALQSAGRQRGRTDGRPAGRGFAA